VQSWHLRLLRLLLLLGLSLAYLLLPASGGKR
jgi:hypothetical protein